MRLGRVVLAVALTATTLVDANDDNLSGLHLSSAEAAIIFGTGTNACRLSISGGSLTSNCPIDTPSGTISGSSGSSGSSSFEVPSSVAVVSATESRRRQLVSSPPTFPSSSDYAQDKSHVYVNDRANEMMGIPNMIMCMVAATAAHKKINQGTYLAWASETQCGTSSDSGMAAATSASGSQSGSEIETFTKMSVTAEQTGDGPMAVKGHLTLPDESECPPGITSPGGCGPPMRMVYFRMVVTKGYIDAPPNGVWQMEYAIKGTVAGSTFEMIRGALGATETGLEWTETSNFGGPSNQVDGIAISSPDPNVDAASGALQGGYGPGDRAMMKFGYNADYFCREEEYGGVTSERCFKRSRDEATISTHRYGVYNADGSRFDLPNPPIQIKTSDDGYGQAGYHGIWTEGTLSDGDTVTSGANFDQTYTVRKGGAKLRKFTRQTMSIADIKGVPFHFRAQQGVTYPAGGTTYAAHKDYTAVVVVESNTLTFKVLSTLSCDHTGCSRTYLPGSAALPISEMKTLVSHEWEGVFYFSGLYAHSEALGQLQITKHCLDADDPLGVTDCVKVFKGVVVPPGDVVSVPTTLKCVRNCFTKTSLGSLESGGRPYKSATDDQQSDRIGDGDVETYTWNKNDYKLTSDSDGNQEVGKSALDSVTIPQDSEFFYGVRMRLVDITAITNLKCDDDLSKICGYKLDDLSEYFEFETGKQDWHKSEFLIDANGDPVVFEPPQIAKVDVPSGAAYGEYSGAKMQLQFEGFGSLHGIPGRCYDKDTNMPANCNQNSFYMPAFALPDGTAVDIDGSTKYIKALDSELRFAPAASGVSTQSQGITLGSLSSLPTARPLNGDASADPKNPSNPANAGEYVGEHSPDLFKGAAAVIHGVVQP